MVPYCAQQSSLQWPQTTLESFSNALIPPCFALELLSCNCDAWVPMMGVPLCIQQMNPGTNPPLLQHPPQDELFLNSKLCIAPKSHP